MSVPQCTIPRINPVTAVTANKVPPNLKAFFMNSARNSGLAFDFLTSGFFTDSLTSILGSGFGVC